jgi:hypothetical protein
VHQHRQDRVRDDPWQVDRHDDAEQRQWNDRQRDDGNGERVGKRGDDRHLLEQRQRSRHEADRDDPLRACRFAQRFADALAERAGLGDPQPIASGVQQQADRTERQPEAGRKPGPRIPAQHGNERPEPYERAGAGPSEPQSARSDDEHQQRAHRGHLGTGEQHIAERDAGTDERGHLARRHVQRQRRASARERQRARAGERREHGDVQARDRDQVRDARPVEYRPLRFRDGALIANGKRDQNAAIRRLGQCAADPLAHTLAGPLNTIAGAPGERDNARVVRVVAHVTRGPQIVLEEPRFEVEAMRIDIAVRTLETRGERPSLAGMHRWRRCGRFVAARTEHVPRERDAMRNDRAGGQHALDREGEARAGLVVLRQVVDDAGDPHVGVLPRGRQCVGQPPIGAPGGIAEAERGTGDDGDRDVQQPASRDERFALRAQRNERDEHERTSGQRQDAGDRRQPRAELQQRCASRKRRQRGDDRKGRSGGFRCGLGHAERA